MKINLSAKTHKEAREYISELFAQDYNDGDKAEVIYPDGTIQVYVFRSGWIKKEDEKYIIEPEI